LIYTAITSLDGFIEDEKGSFDWAEPKEDVHAHINDLERRNEVLVYGRRLYETMTAWESEESLRAYPEYIQDYGRVWRKARKIVYSRTLTKAATGNTEIRSSFAADELAAIKKDTAGDMGIGGPGIAALAIAAGLVDEIHLYIHPVIVGGGKPALGRGLSLRLALEETRSFDGGVTLLRYRCE